jgi:hypothetical protein
MDETSLEKNTGFAAVQANLTPLIDSLCGYVLARG